jgi:hypothetical protein
MYAACLAAMLSPSAVSRATTVQIDYRYDLGFFNPSTPNGIAARAAVNAAAAFFSNIIDDTLSAIPTQPPTTPDPQNTPVWRQIIRHPGTGELNYAISSAANAGQDGLTTDQGYEAADEFRDIQIPANQILIYAGGSSINTAGEGGTGVAYFGTTTFGDLISRRGKPTAEYSTWGGYVTFDNDGGVNWHLNHTQPVPSNKVDLYSTALHEIGHVLGLSPNLSGGQSTPWGQYQMGAEFRGPAALAAWKADDPSAPIAATGVPTVSGTDTHWKDNVPNTPETPSVRSKVIGSNTLQEVAMDPKIFSGYRKHFTNVDGKALRDIGWTIPNSVFNVTTNYLPADFNEDGLVNGTDLTIWRGAFGVNANGDVNNDGDSDGNDFLVWQRQLGTFPSVPSGAVTTAAVPEPCSALLALAGAVAWALVCGRRR